ncbi:MAG: tetratricopeptide repeat protein [Gammaproteobacteria bacterium]|nr:tetratricopeptide repeat protein [Gammaproteobacteria bacterium]
MSKTVWQLLFLASLLMIMWFVWDRNSTENKSSVLPFLEKVVAQPLPQLVKNPPRTAYVIATNKASKIKQSFLAREFKKVESFIESERKNGYTPWDLRSWIDFYIKQLKDDPEKAIFEIEIPRANDWVEHSPDNTYSHSFRGQVYYDLAWQARGKKFSRETPEYSFDVFNQYLKLAEIDIKKALEIDPGNDFAWMQLIAIKRQRSGNHRDEFDTLQSALEQVPNSYRIASSFLHSLQPKWGGSEKLMFGYAKHYAEQEPPVFTQLISQAHRHKAQWIAREKSALDKKSADSDKDENTFRKHFYRYFENDSIWTEYSQGLKKAFKNYPNYTEGLYEYAWTARKSGRIELAIEYFERAMQADAAFLGTDKIYSFAKFLRKERYDDKANQYYRLYLDLLPDYTNDKDTFYAADYVGWQYSRKGDWFASFPYYKLTYELDPESEKTVANYCNALFNIHRYDEGIPYCEKAIEINPNHSWSYFILSKIYERKGDPTIAAQYMEKYDSFVQ